MYIIDIYIYYINILYIYILYVTTYRCIITSCMIQHHDITYMIIWVRPRVVDLSQLTAGFIGMIFAWDLGSHPSFGERMRTPHLHNLWGPQMTKPQGVGCHIENSLQGGAP